MAIASSVARISSLPVLALADDLSNARGDIDSALKTDMARRSAHGLLVIRKVGNDFEFESVGSKVIDWARCDFRGKRLSQLAFNNSDDTNWQACYRLAEGTRRPCFGRAYIKLSSGLFHRYEFLIWPFVEGNEVSFVAYEDYGQADCHSLLPEETVMTPMPPQSSMRRASSTASRSSQGLFGLTGAEMRVGTMLAAGASPREIARALGASIHTIRVHVKRLLEKTDTHRQSELIVTLLNSGL